MTATGPPPAVEPGGEQSWGSSEDRVLAALGSSPAGLSGAEAAQRLARYGPNRLPEARRHVLSILLAQVASPLVLVLIGAALAAYLLGERVDAGVILGVVLLNAMLGFVQEYRAERALQALRRYVTRYAKVLRDGRLIARPAAELVPGDVIRLDLGDVVPGDLRLLTVDDLSTDESTLTGESWPVTKGTTPAPGGRLPQELPCMAFLGSTVASGSATGVVVATGSATFLGRTARLLEAKPRETDFQRNIRRFSGMLVRLIAVLTIFVFAVNFLMHKGWFESFLFAVALAVGITPEVLPAIITITLANGALRMARDQVVTKRLMSVEDLGNIDILCCDKTGTLTEGAFTVRGAVGVDGRPDERVFLAAALATPGEGSPLDRAVRRCPEYARLKSQLATYRLVDHNPFDHERRRESALVRGPGGTRLVVKGAPEAVLAACTTLTGAERDRIRAVVGGHERKGTRVIAVAARDLEAETTVRSDETDLSLLGLLFFEDPPKPTAADSLRRLAELGVRVKVLSGDTPVVTERVCREVGLPFADGEVVTGAELDGIDGATLAESALRHSVFARLSPDQKRAIVAALRESGHVVGVLGDGVNDAPALRAADVGISVDSGTDVTKDAADIILLRKDLTVLAGGILEGRKTFANVTKYIYNTVSANFGNMTTVALASLFLPFIPLLPSQILLNNFLSDVPLVTVATDRVDPQLIQRPRSWSIGRITRFMVYFGTLSALFDLVLIGVFLLGLRASIGAFRTAWFVESAVSEILVTFAIRTRLPFYRSTPSRWLLLTSVVCVVIVGVAPYTSWGQRLFALVPLPGLAMSCVAAVLATYFAAAELGKRWFFRRWER